MTKTKSNASWNKLTPKQRERLDGWLFEENLSYADVLIKASRELGYRGSQTSLRRYYERRRQERLLTDLKEAGRDMTEVRGLDTDPDVSRKASMQMLGAYLFRALRAAPDKVKEWAPVANLLVQNDRNEALREIKGEEQKIRREALEFAKEKYRFDVAEQALKALPELQELAEAKKDPNLKEYEGNIRLNRTMRLMLGAGHKIHPESEQEAKEMLAAKRERLARQKAAEEAAAERRQVREELGGAQPPTPSSQYYAEYMAERAQAEAGARERERAFRASRAKVSVATETEREKLRRVLREAQAEREADEQERERALREYQAKAAEISGVEQAQLKKLQEQQETERAERKKRREEREAQARARLEEMREVCGGQEAPRRPGTEEEK